jgi:hypothetical protein
VLYRSHPEVEHAEYVVRCMHGFAPSQEPSNAIPQANATSSGAVGLEPEARCSAAASTSSRDFAWPELMAGLRVAGQVRKKLLLLFVHFAQAADLSCPSCLLAVQV